MVKKVYLNITEMLDKMRDDYLSAFSAQATFFILMSFFPFMLFLLTMAQFMPFTKQDVVSAISGVIPSDITPYIISIVNELYGKATGTLISFSAIVLVWSASKGIMAIMRGLNAIYRTDESRGYVILRLISTVYTFVVAIVVVGMLSIFVFGNTILNKLTAEFSEFADIAGLIISLRTGVGIIIIFLFFILIYKKLPSHDVKHRDEIPGALFATAGWILLSYVFSIFVDSFTNMSYMYGSLAGIIICLLWLYVCMYILFLGAELNYFIHEGYLTRLKNVIK